MIADIVADVAVLGAGVFGASTALALLDAGFPKVLLLDAWGAGNARATSGDHSRVSRVAYGQKRLYSKWSRDSLITWKQWERETGTPMFVPTGVLWLAGTDREFTQASVECLRDLRVPVEEWPAGEAAHRFPQFTGIEDRAAIYEPAAGVLLARQALLAVVDMFRCRGGVVDTGEVLPPSPKGHLQLTDGRTISAGACVFACGPWLPALFPSLLREKMTVTRQEVFYFTPPSGGRFEAGALPTWIDEGLDAQHEFSFYGMPNIGPGVKLASDIRGPRFDPTFGDRTTAAAGAKAARDFLAKRLPALAGAEIVESRVCQYEQTPDSHLIIDRHPDFANAWIAGGGSGHGFKLGPEVGRLVAACVHSGKDTGIDESLKLR